MWTGFSVKSVYEYHLLWRKEEPMHNGFMHKWDSPMHLAIKKPDNFQQIQQLLDGGDKFCAECFVVAVTSRDKEVSYEEPESTWQLVKWMLDRDPAAVNIQDYDGMTLVVVFYSSWDRVQHLISLGADITIHDSEKYDLMQRLAVHYDGKERTHPYLFDYPEEFIPNEEATKLAENCLKVWQELIGLPVAQGIVIKVTFMKRIVSFALYTKDVVTIKMLYDVLKIGSQNEVTFSTELRRPPLFFLIDQAFANCKHYAFFDVMESLLELEERDADTNFSLLGDRNVLHEDNDCFGIHNTCAHMRRMETLLNNQDKPRIFDVFGSIVNSMLHSGEEVDPKILVDFLHYFLKKSFVPSPSALHPIYVLLDYKMLNKLRWDNGRFWTCSTNLVVKLINSFKEFPFPHKMIEDPETGFKGLDIHFLVAMMMFPRSRDLVQERSLLIESVMGLLQLSPAHPLEHFANFYKYLAKQTFHERAALEDVANNFLRELFDSCGAHRFQGIDMRVTDCINTYLQVIEKPLPDLGVEYPEELNSAIGVETPLVATPEVTTLKWACILQIRKTIFESRKKTTDYLPSLIRTLGEDGYLPKGLTSDLLVYKENTLLTF